MNNKIILVIGATGQQGGAAARHLLNAGWKGAGIERPFFWMKGSSVNGILVNEYYRCNRRMTFFTGTAGVNRYSRNQIERISAVAS